MEDPDKQNGLVKALLVLLRWLTTRKDPLAHFANESAGMKLVAVVVTSVCGAFKSLMSVVAVIVSAYVVRMIWMFFTGVQHTIF